MRFEDSLSSRKPVSSTVGDSRRSSKGSSASGLLTPTPRERWSSQSKEFEKKLEEVANTVDLTDPSTRKKIWDKFDKQKKGVLDTEKSLIRLIYSLMALYVKTKNRKAEAPKIKALQPLLVSIVNDIRPLLKREEQITRNDFVDNIARYLKQVAAERKNQLARGY